MFLTPITKRIIIAPINKLEIGKMWETSIKNPNKYNTGNFNKSNIESFNFDFCKIAILSKFIISNRLIKDQAAPVNIPAIKLSFGIIILILLIYIYNQFNNTHYLHSRSNKA